MYKHLQQPQKVAYWEDYLKRLTDFKADWQNQNLTIADKINLEAEIRQVRKHISKVSNGLDNSNNLVISKFSLDEERSSNKTRSVFSTVAREHSFLHKSIKSRIN